MGHVNGLATAFEDAVDDHVLMRTPGRSFVVEPATYVPAIHACSIRIGWISEVAIICADIECLKEHE
jgi:hypothetical protein